MSENTDKILSMAENRQLSSREINTLRACIQALEKQKLPPENVLVRRNKELKSKLESCHNLINKYDLNEYMD